MAEHKAVTNSGLILSDEVYDMLRQVVEKVLPGIGLLYAAFAAYWGWGYAFEVSGSIAALAVFGGLLLSLSRKGRTVNPDAPPGGYDGQVVEDVNAEGLPILRVELDPAATEDIMNKQQIVIKGYDAGA